MNNIRRNKVITELVANGGSIASAMRKAGYSPNTARTPKKLTQSKAFKKEAEPILNKYEKLRNRVVDAMISEQRDLSQEELYDLSVILKNTTHDIQLLSGETTENLQIYRLSEMLNDWINSAK